MEEGVEGGWEGSGESMETQMGGSSPSERRGREEEEGVKGREVEIEGGGKGCAPMECLRGLVLIGLFSGSGVKDWRLEEGVRGRERGER